MEAEQKEVGVGKVARRKEKKVSFSVKDEELQALW